MRFSGLLCRCGLFVLCLLRRSFNSSVHVVNVSCETDWHWFLFVTQAWPRRLRHKAIQNKKAGHEAEDPYVLECVDASFHSQQLVHALGGALLAPGLLGSERSALDTKEVKDFFQENDVRQILLQARQAYRQSKYRDVRNELSAAHKARGFFKQKKEKDTENRMLARGDTETLSLLREF